MSTTGNAAAAAPQQQQQQHASLTLPVPSLAPLFDYTGRRRRMPSSSVTRWNSSGMTAPATANTPPSSAAAAHPSNTLSLSLSLSLTSRPTTHTLLSTPLSLSHLPSPTTHNTNRTQHRYVDVPHTVEKYSTGPRVIVTEWVYGRHLDALNTAEGLRMTYMAVEACTASLVVTGKCCCSTGLTQCTTQHCDATDPPLPLTGCALCLLRCRCCARRSS